LHGNAKYINILIFTKLITSNNEFNNLIIFLIYKNNVLFLIVKINNLIEFTNIFAQFIMIFLLLVIKITICDIKLINGSLLERYLQSLINFSGQTHY